MFAFRTRRGMAAVALGASAVLAVGLTSLPTAGASATSSPPAAHHHTPAYLNPQLSVHRRTGRGVAAGQ